MRVKGGVRTRQRHKKVLKLTSGQRGAYHRLFRRANEGLLHAQRLNMGIDGRIVFGQFVDLLQFADQLLTGQLTGLCHRPDSVCLSLSRLSA